MAQPAGKAPAFAPQVGGDVRRHQAGLDQEGAHPAHGVGQGATGRGQGRPAGTDQHRGRQVFLERRRALLQAIAALVQALTGEIQREDGLAALQVQVDAQIRSNLVHRGPLPGALAQAVDDGVLDLERTEVGVVDARALAAEAHRQGTRGRQVFFPLHPVHAQIQPLGVFHREARQHQQHPIGQSRPEAQAVGIRETRLAAHRRGLAAGFLQAEALGLFQQQGLESLGTGEDELLHRGHR